MEFRVSSNTFHPTTAAHFLPFTFQVFLTLFSNYTLILAFILSRRSTFLSRLQKSFSKKKIPSHPHSFHRLHLPTQYPAGSSPPLYTLPKNRTRLSHFLPLICSAFSYVFCIAMTSPPRLQSIFLVRYLHACPFPPVLV